MTRNQHPAFMGSPSGVQKKAATTPLPESFPKNEIALMTASEFLAFRNPDDIMHGSDAYDFDLAEMNRSYLRSVDHRFGDEEYNVAAPSSGLSHGYLISDGSNLVAVVHKNTMFYGGHIDPERNLRAWQAFGVRSFKRVKYVADYAPLVYAVAEHNRKSYPVLLQSITVKGEPYQVRAKGHPKEDALIDLAVLNAKGEVVASAQNEWGATLLVTAREYRGYGFGQILGKYWYKFNPSSTSGGFTYAGQSNALRLWESRVRDFVANGWYSELIRQGRLTRARVAEIFAGLKGHKVHLPEPTKPKSELLFYSDGTTFVIYDARFLTMDDPGESLVHAYGFLRDMPRVGTFYYTFDYDRDFKALATEAALQMAKDEGVRLYVGKGYGDFMDLDGIPGLEHDGDYVWLSRDILPLRSLAAKEKRQRKVVDPYEQLQASLLEAAESKWLGK